MAPKKSSSRAHAAPATRRSKRLASRETSTEAEDGLLSPNLLVPFPLVKSPYEDSLLAAPAAMSVPQRAAGDAASTWSAAGFIFSVRRGGEIWRVDALTRKQVDEVAKKAIVGWDEAEEREQRAERRARPSIRRDFGLAKITASYEAKQRLLSGSEEDKQQTGPSPSSAAPTPSHPAAMTPRRVSENEALATPAQPATAPPPPSAISKLLGGIWGYFGSPAVGEEKSIRRSTTTTKRAAENDEEVDEDASSRATKRVRVQEPVPESESEPEDDEEPEASTTPRPTFTPASPHRSPYVGPSTKNRRVPTSLSVISEHTEPSQTSFLDNTPSKPSRAPPSRGLQAPQNTPAVTPHHTNPTPSTLSSELSNTSSLPQSTPTQPFIMRRTALKRATMAAAAKNQPPPKPFAWNRTPQRPKEPNADARLEKITRIRELEKQLQELKQDDDVKDIEAHSIHRRKRVKIDDLAVIPHNRPGDSSSTFRVPDYDSDEEIEVDDSMDLSGDNMFESINTTQGTQGTQDQLNTPLPATAPPTTPRQQPSSLATPSATHHHHQQPSSLAGQVPEQAQHHTPPPQEQVRPSAFPSVGSSQQQQQQQHQAIESQTPPPQEQARPFAFPSVGTFQHHQATVPTLQLSQEQLPVYDFPSVGKRSHDYEVSEEYKAAAGRDFTKGYQEWLAAN